MTNFRRVANLHSDDRLVHALLDAAAAEVPDATAVRDAAGAWTYRELADHSHAVAGWLTGQGVGRGDRVVVRLPTTRALVALWYGCARAGAVFVPLNPDMKPFHLKSVLDNAEPRLVICADDARRRSAA